jgi:hypothetical protein
MNFAKDNSPVVFIHVTEGEEFEEGTHGWKFHPYLDPGGDDVCIKKNDMGCVLRTELGSVLHRMNSEVPYL